MDKGVQGADEVDICGPDTCQYARWTVPVPAVWHILCKHMPKEGRTCLPDTQGCTKLDNRDVLGPHPQQPEDITSWASSCSPPPGAKFTAAHQAEKVEAWW